MSERSAGKKGEQEGMDEDVLERGNFERGVSVEGEFAFTKAVGEFCRKAVGGGGTGGITASTSRGRWNKGQG